MKIIDKIINLIKRINGNMSDLTKRETRLDLHIKLLMW